MCSMAIGTALASAKHFSKITWEPECSISQVRLQSNLEAARK